MKTIYLYATTAQLPDNIDLIKFLGTKHNAKFNAPALNQNGILHLISHTKPDVHAVKFLFDKDTISLNTNGLRPDMAILHGCRSSSGKLVFSGYLSLDRTFLFSGTKAVISSYWDADNASSVFYFKEFYKHLMAGKSTSESMYSAQKAVRNNPKYVEWSKPFYWAGWRLIGQDLVFSQP
jgi:CHAT domain-containing protein